MFDALLCCCFVCFLRKQQSLDCFLLEGVVGFPCACFGSMYTKVGKRQRGLAWPQHKDGTQILVLACGRTGITCDCSLPSDTSWKELKDERGGILQSVANITCHMLFLQ